MHFNCKLIPSTLFLDWDCFVDLDALGLPAEPKIHHVQQLGNDGFDLGLEDYGCGCGGIQDSIIINYIQEWIIQVGQILQVDSRAATVVAFRLLDRWALGVGNWLAMLDSLVPEWRAMREGEVMLNNLPVRIKIRPSKVVKRRRKHVKKYQTRTFIDI